RFNYPFNTGLNPWTSATGGALNGPAYFPGWNDSRPPGTPPGGPAYFTGLQADRPVTIASITDGTSNTAVFSEWVRGDGIPPPNSANGLGQVYNFAPSIASIAFVGQTAGVGVRQDYLYAQACYNTAQLGPNQGWTWKGDWWISGQSATYSHTQLPN